MVGLILFYYAFCSVLLRFWAFNSYSVIEFFGDVLFTNNINHFHVFHYYAECLHNEYLYLSG